MSNRVSKTVGVPRRPPWKVIRITHKLDSNLKSSELKQKGKSVYSLDVSKYIQARPEI